MALCKVVIALVKLENLKAIHNGSAAQVCARAVVIALVKLENLKAIHNRIWQWGMLLSVVIALVKLENSIILQHKNRKYSRNSIPLASQQS